MDSTIEDIGSSKELYDNERKIFHSEIEKKSNKKITNNERCDHTPDTLNP